MVKKIALAIVLSSIAMAASAKEKETCEWVWHGWLPVLECTKDKPVTVAKAPEIDPASAMGGLTLLLGGLVVLRGRRSKTSEV